ncbi:FtsH protease activity modulator HflK [Pacificibacter marinus]|uniref:Protein HflK n=1 Tax=Pacificibacter marinus TaxID=658057 RepID=A0A1Y5SQB6_9RHOB|nr:FtsH protease activity modulator HflK [Pacificibacter marinus]SEK68305.1 protease FtsH subunit HflK [Pacificibacter marinus]SLN45969.1 Modulator of FtsH protease HflK [Pacificibacter marinus]
MASNNGGPWGSGGGGNRGNGSSDNDREKPTGGDRRPGGNQTQIPEIDQMLNKGNEYLKVLMGGKGGGNGSGSGGPSGQGGVPKGLIALGVVGAVGIWLFSSFYTVQTEQNGVELFLGQYHRTTTEGLKFAPWPIVTHELVNVTGQRSESIGTVSTGDDGLMLTTDENIVDIDFQVVWNINDSSKYLFNLAYPRETVRAVSESSMREIIASSELSPILNRDRGLISDTAKTLIQSTLDDLDAGISIVRVNLDKADPPEEVINAFRDVQAAEQERDRLERQADAYANTVVAGARGTSAQILEEAEGYRARVVNEAQGEASRFTAVLGEYQNAPEVTRKRLYLETIEEVYSGIDKIILDEGAEGSGVVPYLPLNELKKTAGTN